MVRLSGDQARAGLKKFARRHPRKGRVLLARFEALPPEERREFTAPGLSVRIGLAEDDGYIGPHGCRYHRGVHPAIYPDGSVTFRSTGDDGVHYAL